MSDTSTIELDIFAELDAEIAVASKKANIKSTMEANRKKASNMFLAKPQREAAKALYLEALALSEAQSWRLEASCALFTVQTCDGCGSTHTLFLQFMEKFSLIRLPTTVRWQRVPALRDGLPRRTIIQNHKTSICGDCATDHGFFYDEPMNFMLPDNLSLSPSATYTQEDVNAPSEED